ncbi:hypothetical protein PPACK8108_LOCUS20772, partial [Phakopsora pachyrhizi]
INSSSRLANDILSQAYETRYQFYAQLQSILGSNSRMGNVVSLIPGVNSLISMINSRRKHDTLILSIVAGSCTLMLLFATFR